MVVCVCQQERKKMSVWVGVDNIYNYYFFFVIRISSNTFKKRYIYS
jgi:hypothetical protein